MNVRVHNDLVMQMRLAGKGEKMEFIDPERIKAEENILNDDEIDDNIEGLEKSTNEYLAQVRAKHG